MSVISTTPYEQLTVTTDTTTTVVASDSVGLVAGVREGTTVVEVNDDPETVVTRDTGGIQGPPGPSNYDIWLGLGNVGTEQDFLDQFRPVVSYRHVQAEPAAVWLIQHDLGFYPGGIHVTDSAGTVVEGEIRQLSTSTLEIEFASGFSGTADLS